MVFYLLLFTGTWVSWFHPFPYKTLAGNNFIKCISEESPFLMNGSALQLSSQGRKALGLRTQPRISRMAYRLPRWKSFGFNILNTFARSMLINSFSSRATCKEKMNWNDNHKEWQLSNHSNEVGSSSPVSNFSCTEPNPFKRSTFESIESKIFTVKFRK